MKTVLLSGGSGERLWPLSNSVRSKQFLKLLVDEEGKPESMVQRVYRQLVKSDQDAEILIATSKNQENSIRSNLSDLVSVVIEPERRDTFPAIALSTAYLHYVENADLDETISIMPVDPYTSQNFFEKVYELNHKLADSEYNLGLLGIKPTYPSSKYGYILNENYVVNGFVEKPSEDTAAELIKDGAMWNGGVFVFKIKYVLDILKNHISFDSYEEVQEQYYKLPKNSFDYEVSEKEHNITMIEYDGFWKDLGTWNTLTEVMDNQTFGKVIKSKSSSNTHVINELDIPITVIGAKNMVVAASPDGILVSDKTESAHLKSFIADLPKLPKYEETVWGSSKVLEITESSNGSNTITKSIFIKKGNQLCYQRQNVIAYKLILVSGSGRVESDKRETAFLQGDTLSLDCENDYIIVGKDDLKIIEISIER
ncbi:sugar phosphate nucleotidyltransferase [Marinilactibacillus sp. XAAS-LB27]|uniref:sugar phosphate nucleotidyltransferase n=1 Tax=Marinilactibacillus sp. XAAS-LB27 TaxID=3114538 RepID=UPI002E191F0C|nr:sugar phosphate nucleotidyltransferase [Marinilactibacillus sp. XAAS-LB27]